MNTLQSMLMPYPPQRFRAETGTTMGPPIFEETNPISWPHVGDNALRNNGFQGF
jgi:hypothetical protein